MIERHLFISFWGSVLKKKLSTDGHIGPCFSDLFLGGGVSFRMATAGAWGGGVDQRRANDTRTASFVLIE